MRVDCGSFCRDLLRRYLNPRLHSGFGVTGGAIPLFGFALAATLRAIPVEHALTVIEASLYAPQRRALGDLGDCLRRIPLFTDLKSL